MTSLVLNLQKLALESENSITTLLMQALVVARKLKIKEFENWIKSELDGYDLGSVIPEYRKNRCQIKMHHPYQGWQSIIYASREKEEALSQVQVLQPISEIEQLRKYGPGEITMPLPSDLVMHFQESVGASFPVDRFVSKTSIDKMCEAVRKIVLEWALDLEERGVLGNETTFTDEEKTIAAASMPQLHIAGNFYGILGNVNNSSITQSIDASIEKNNLESLQDALKKMGVEDDDIESLTAAVKAEPTIESPKKFGEKVAEWIGIMTTKALSGAWKTATAAPAQVLAQAVCHYYGFS